MELQVHRAGRAIALFDHVYRRWHRLDEPASKVDPLLSIGRARAWRGHRLPDGTLLRRGDHYGELHLDNLHVLALRQRSLSPVQLGLEFRRQLRGSLATLASVTGAGGRFEDLVAFSAVTIFHQGLRRLGFELDREDLRAARLVGAYQHALLLWLAAHPGPHRSPVAQRLWISRGRLQRLYAPLRRAS